MALTTQKVAALRPLKDWFAERLDAMLAELGWLVEQETPSGAKAALDRTQEQLAERFREAGAHTEIISSPTGNHLLARVGPVVTEGQLFVIGHVDTVWPMGTLVRKPFQIEAGRAYGPGVYDMKAGLIMLLFALRALQEHKLTPNRSLTFLVSADEEVGSHTSRTLIEQEARKAAGVLVLEPPLENGAVKTARKGVGLYTLKVQGRAAHAGVEPEKGINALVEMAHQILAINALNDYPKGTTLNVGVLEGGTRPNVVPAEATAKIDLRVSTMAEAERISTALQTLQTVLPGAKLELQGGLNRPPFERTPTVVDLFQQAAAIAEAIQTGESLQEGATGGGSDGNFTAALGIPTLDGLGAVGAGAHAEHEQMQIDSLPRRAHLLTGLLAVL